MSSWRSHIAHATAAPRQGRRRSGTRRVGTAALAALAIAPVGLRAQAPGARIPGGCEAAATNRPNDVGCYLLTTRPLVAGPGTALFWHIYEYDTPAAATADSSRGARVPRPVARNVVQAFGRTWLLALADSLWRPAAGRRAGVAGPLPVSPGKRYAARYMEAVFSPGMQTAVHRHSGPEAWYLVTGAQCLQTPDTTFVVPAGGSAVVPAGPPMRLSGVGTATRRALVLVLHDPAEPWMTMDPAWTPPAAC